MAWWRAHDEAVDDPKLQKLPPDEFRRQFYAALRGEENAFSRHLKRGSDRPVASVWAALRAAVFKRDDFTCTYCGERGRRLECDHIEPVARGGQHGMDNLTTACLACNRSKRDKTLAEWRTA